ncbi:MAG: hypothetical protein U0835_16865 [Isosphaeraceae bacterium]
MTNAKAAGEGIARGEWGERWRTLKIEAELARGKDAEAMATLNDALRRYPASVPLRMLARDVAPVQRPAGRRRRHDGDGRGGRAPRPRAVREPPRDASPSAGSSRRAGPTPARCSTSSSTWW